MTTTEPREILVAITSRVTHDPERLILCEGRRYRADSPEVIFFGRARFVRDGATSAEVGAAKQALRASQPRSEYRQPKAPISEGRHSATAIARRRFTAGERLISRGQALSTDDPAVHSFPAEFEYPVDGEARGGLRLSALAGLFGR